MGSQMNGCLKTKTKTRTKTKTKKNTSLYRAFVMISHLAKTTPERKFSFMLIKHLTWILPSFSETLVIPRFSTGTGENTNSFQAFLLRPFKGYSPDSFEFAGLLSLRWTLQSGSHSKHTLLLPSLLRFPTSCSQLPTSLDNGLCGK